MARDRSTPVPHHLVEAALYDAASDKATATGRSMSGIAAEGLAYLAARVPESSAKQAREEAKEALTTDPAVQSLPEDVRENLRSMKTNRDPLLNPYLVALADAGWSYSALCEPLGVSRQAIYDRVRKWRGQELPPYLPDVPEPPFRMPTPYSLGYERVDWPIWVDREIYAVVSRDAKRRMEPMRVVMENILRDFINDRGPWERKE